MNLARTLAGGLVALCLALPLASVPAAWAVEPDEILKDPALEKRARGLSVELRCLVCQNQSIDDSNAPLARDLRIVVRERLVAGDTDAQVRDYLVTRYGSFVLLKPPFNASTLLLWLTPVFVLGLAVVLVRRWVTTTQPGLAGREVPLLPEEQSQLERVLSEHASSDVGSPSRHR